MHNDFDEMKSLRESCFSSDTINAARSMPEFMLWGSKFKLFTQFSILLKIIDHSGLWFWKKNYLLWNLGFVLVCLYTKFCLVIKKTPKKINFSKFHQWIFFCIRVDKNLEIIIYIYRLCKSTIITKVMKKIWNELEENFG